MQVQLSLCLGRCCAGMRHAAEVRAAVVIQSRLRSRPKQLSLMMQLALARLPPGAVAHACVRGLDGMRILVERTLGKHVWVRAVHNVPDEWEEEQMRDAMTNVLCAPAVSKHMWLLATPSKHEQALLSAFRTVKGARAS